MSSVFHSIFPITKAGVEWVEKKNTKESVYIMLNIKDLPSRNDTETCQIRFPIFVMRLLKNITQVTGF